MKISNLLKLILVSVLFILSNHAHAANILVNGDFELGNTGFSTSFNYSPTTIFNVGQYTITNDPPSAHSAATSYGDHTSGTGLMMMVNGSDRTVWSEVVSLVPSKTYEFSGFLSSWLNPNPAQLDIRIDGASIGTVTASLDLGIWEGFSFLFSSNATSSATVEIINFNATAAGTDFALDDLSLSQIPIPPALYLFGSGLLGLIGISRRKKTA